MVSNLTYYYVFRSNKPSLTVAFKACLVVLQYLLLSYKYKTFNYEILCLYNLNSVKKLAVCETGTLRLQLHLT